MLTVFWIHRVARAARVDIRVLPRMRPFPLDRNPLGHLAVCWVWRGLSLVIDYQFAGAQFVILLVLCLNEGLISRGS